MLKIKLPLPPYDEQFIKKFCDDIVEVKFDPLPNPISCIAIVNHGADVENIANLIRAKDVFGKNLEVEVINDDESLYQEHIEADDDDVSMSIFNDFERINVEPKQEGIDDKTFEKLLQMRLRGPRPVTSNDDVIEILSDTSEEDLDNEDVLSIIDDEANTFINDLLEIQNSYTTKSGDTEESPNSSANLLNESTDDKSSKNTEADLDRFVPAANQNNDKLEKSLKCPSDFGGISMQSTDDQSSKNTESDFDRFVPTTTQNNEKLEKSLKRPSDFGGISMQSLLDTINKPVSDSNKKVKRDRLDSLHVSENVPSEENNRTVSFNQNQTKHSDSDLNCNSKNPTRRLSFTEYNGTSEDTTTF